MTTINHRRASWSRAGQSLRAKDQPTWLLRTPWLWLALQLVGLPAYAGSLYWDTNGITAGAGGSSPGGTWGVDSFWSTSSAGTVATGSWTSGEVARFSAGNDAAGSFTVGVSGTQTVGGLVFEEGGVTLQGGVLSLSGSPVITINTGLKATISSSLTGAAPSVVGPGELVLNTSNSFVGGLTLKLGTLNLNDDAAAGTGAISILNSGNLMLRSSKPGVVTLTNEITLGVSSGYNTDFGAAAGSTLVLNGVISGSTDWRVNDPGTLVLGGASANTFNALLTVAQGMLVVRKDFALGSVSKGTVVNNGATLAFDGGVAYSAFPNPEPVNLIGTGVAGLGALRNLGTNNIFDAVITLTGDTSFGADSGVLSVYGDVSGAFKLTKVGPGIVDLYGANSYGSTVVSNGTLGVFYPGTAGSGPVTVVAGARLEGNGTVAGPVALSGTISPGSSPDILSTGPETWNGGARYQWELSDAAGAAGSLFGWDSLNISGGLTNNATSGNKFTIELVSLDPYLDNEPGLADQWDYTQNYTWRIAATTAGIVGFDPATFQIDTSNFQNDLGPDGVFMLEQAGNDLNLRFVHRPVITVAPVSQTNNECGSVTFTVTATGAAPLHYYWTHDSSPVGSDSATLTINDLVPADQGSYSVVVSNFNNLTDTASATLTVVDPPPVIAGCPADITVPTGPGAITCNKVVTWTPPTVSDNCPGVTMVADHNPGDTFPVGPTLVTYTATDNNGQHSTCSFTVTVEDNTPPEIAGCPTNIFVLDPEGDGQTASWTPPTASDNCSVNLTSDFNPGANFPVGTTTVTYTATDPATNIATCSFTVTVVDTRTMYVDDDYSGKPAGTAVVWPDTTGTGPHYLGYDAFATIQAGIDAVVSGGTVKVAAGTYAEDLFADKPVTLLGPNATINPNTGTRVAEAVILPATSDPDPNSNDAVTMLYVDSSGVLIKGFTFDGDNPSLTNGVLVGAANVDACEAIAAYGGVGSITVANNIVKNIAYAGLDFYNYSNPAATADNYIQNNQFANIGHIPYGYGIGVLIYNNFYAEISGNVMTGVRKGIQTGNFSKANPGTTASIHDNNITATRFGLFYNLHYSAASPFSIFNNAFGVLDETGGAVRWEAVVLSSQQQTVSATISNNTITATPVTQTTVGYDVWNCPSTGSLTIQGGTVSGCAYGAWVNNYDGYNSSGDSSVMTLDGVAITGATIAGVYVKDNPLNNNGATARAVLQGGCSISSSAVGILVDGVDASAAPGDTALASLTGNYISLTNAAASGLDATSVGFDGQVGSAMSLTDLFTVEDRVQHKVDDASLGLVRVKADNVYVTLSSGSIQRGIDAAALGNTVNVGAGTFTENLALNKRVILAGQGSGANPAADTIINAVAANTPVIIVSASGASVGDRIVAKDIRVAGATGSGNAGTGIAFTAPGSFYTFDNVTAAGNAGNGMAVNFIGNAADMIITGSSFVGNGEAGFRLPTAGGLNGLSVKDSHFDGNVYGWEVYMGNGSGSVFNNISVTNSTFNNNSSKGIYAEKLSDASFSSITVSNSGTAGGFSAGMDINLKYGAYQNIQITDCDILNCGTGDPVNGAGIAIKARGTGSDSGYASNPATLTGVTLAGLNVNGCPDGVRFGEPGKNNEEPTGVSVHNCNLAGNTANGIRNETQSLASASNNWWGNLSGPTSASLNYYGTGVGVSGSVTISPWLANGTDTSPAVGFQPAPGLNYIPTHLAFTTQPGGAALGNLLAPQPKVEVWDVNNHVTPWANPTVSVGLGNNPGLGVLAGTTNQNASSGVATYSDLAVTVGGGSALTLVAQAPGLTGATSDAFDVGNPLPVLTSLNPAGAVTGSGGGNAAVTLTGSGFLPVTVVLVDGAPVASSYGSATQLTATLSTTAAGHYSIQVSNPPAAGGVSGALSFTVDATPTVVYVDDNFTPANSGGHAWGFDAFATIQNGVDAVAAGGTVNVAAGTYAAVNLNKSVTLLGADAGTACGGAGSSVISNPAGTAVTIAADNVTVDGFAIAGATGVSDAGFANAVVRNNQVNAGALGIAVQSVNGPFTVKDNCVNVAVQEISGNPTVGIQLASLSGAGPQVISSNNIGGALYGYLIADVNSASPLTLSGGNITGVMQGVAAINYNLAYAQKSSAFVVDGVSMSGFAGTSSNPDRNFHAGVYVYTGGSDNTATITATLTNVTVTGTGKIAQDCAALSFADFSTAAGPRQTITVLNSTLSNNLNRGVNVRGSNAVVTVTGSTLTGNGGDPFGSDGNDGFGIIARVGATVNVSECVILNPATQAGYTVTSLAMDAGPGAGPTMTVANNSIDNNGNTSGRLAMQSGGTLNASGNWWGTTSDTTIVGLMTGSVDFTPYLASGTDTSAAAGFQGDFSALQVTAQGGQTAGTRIQEGIDLVTAGGTVQVGAGSFAENVVVPKQVHLLGLRAGVDARTRTGLETIVMPGVNNPGWDGVIILIQAPNVTVDGFTVDGDNTALTGGVDVNGADANAGQGITTTPDGGSTGYALSGVTVRNNIIRNLTCAGFYGYSTTPSGGNHVDHNLVDNLPLHGPTYYGWGAVVENNFYAQISDNLMTRVRTGIQVDNTWQADPVSETPTIANNDISYRWRGILHNLQYSGASAWTIRSNNIAAAGDAIPLNGGLRIWSIQSAVGATIQDNNVSGAYMGVEIWNVPTTSTITVHGGTLSGNAYGVRMPQSSTYGEANSGQAVLDGATILNSTIAGVAVDAPSTNLQLTVTHCTVSGSPAGVLITGAAAVGRVVDNSASLTTNNIGIDVDAGKALVQNNNLTDNTTAAIRASNGAIVDAGACGGTDILGGLGISTGGNLLTGYLTTGKAIINGASTVRAYGNSFGATAGAPSISGAFTGIVSASQSGGLLATLTLAGSTVECPDGLPAPATTLAGFLALGGAVSATDGVTVSPADGALTPGPTEGNVTRTYTLMDACGQVATSTQDLIVDDTIAPSIVTCATNQTILADISAQAPIPDVTNQIVATDNCSSSLTLSQTPVAGTMVGLGAHPVTVWAADQGGNSNSCTATITVIDTNAPVLTVPADVTVTTLEDKDPYATGYATATDANGPVTITYNDDRNGLSSCDATGVILRTWTATDAANNVSTGVQTVTVIDTNAPVFTSVPAAITVTNDPNLCSAVVNFAATAMDLGCQQGFENGGWTNGEASANPSTDWNDYNGHIYRVASGTDGIVSRGGGAHAVIDPTGAAPDGNGVFSRLGGYSTVFGTGYRVAQDIYIDLSDPNVVNATATTGYAWDLSAAANGQNGGHRRDFVFHAAAYDATGVVIGADNGSSDNALNRRNDLLSLPNHGVIASSGWYTFAWVFRATNDVLAVDLSVSDTNGLVLFTQTLSDPSDLISTVVGGHRYLWFTFIATDKLAIDNTVLERNATVVCAPPSGSVFPGGSTVVTCTATDECGNSTNTTFSVTVEDHEAPKVSAPANLIVECDQSVVPPATGNGTALDNCDSSPGVAYSDGVPVTFNDSSLGDWLVTAQATAVGHFVDGPGMPVLGAGSYQVSTGPGTGTGSGSGGKHWFMNTNYAGLPLRALTELKYSTYVDPASTATGPVATAINIAVDWLGDGSTWTTLVFEPAYTPAQGTLTTGVWQSWDAGHGFWWSTRNMTNAAGTVLYASFTYTKTLADLLALFPNAKIASVSAGGGIAFVTGQNSAGNPWSGYIGGFDGIVIGVSNSSVALDLEGPGALCAQSENIVRTWSGTDAAGNIGRATQLIKVVDTTPPVPHCPADIVQNCDPGECGAVVTYAAATATDNCDPSPAAGYSIPSGAHFPVGVTTVTNTAVDACGNTAQSTFTVTVIDNQAPSLTAGSVASCYHTQAEAETAATNATVIVENCGVASVVAATSGDPCSATITVTVTDTAGLTAQVQYLTRIDNEAPVIGAVSAVQFAQDVKDGAHIVKQGTVSIAVVAGDNCSLVGGHPALTLTNGAASEMPVYVGESPAGTFNYTWAVTAATLNGTWTADIVAADLCETTNASFVLNVNKSQITGLVQLEGFTGNVTNRSRAVTFVATTNSPTVTNVVASWTMSLTNAGGDTFDFTLTGVPDGTTALSARTDWNLRRRLAVALDGNGQGTVNFTNPGGFLKAGDIVHTGPSDNAVVLDDYYTLVGVWLGSDPAADLNGDGVVNVFDYSLLSFNWYVSGDPQ